MKQEQQSGNSKGETAPNDTNYFALFCASMALVPELLLHDPRTFGIRSVFPRVGGAVLMIYVFAVAYVADDKTPLLFLAIATIILSILAYIAALLRERRQSVLHSRYNGTPWLSYLMPMSEERMKRCEPFMVVATGWFVHPWNCPLGTFLIWVGACHGFRVVFGYLNIRNRELDFNDALAEQTIAMRAMKRRRRH
jgi:hypothetical protein